MTLRVDFSVTNHALASQSTVESHSKVQVSGVNQTASQTIKEQKYQEQKPHEQVSLEDLATAAEHLGQALEVINRGLEFSIHEDTNRIIVRVINRETQEVLKEIPPEQLLDMIARIWDVMGLIVDEKA